MWGNYESPRLEVSKLKLVTRREIEIATIIAEETEQERALLRERVPDSPPTQPGVVGRGLLGDGSFSYADSVRWDELLTDGDCLGRCAVRAQLLHSTVVRFAIDKCNPPDWRMLFWFQTWLEEAGRRLDAEALRAALQSKQKRLSDGGRRGAAKSSETRKAKAKIPSPRVLRAERDQKIAAGHSPSGVAGVLANKYRVTPGAIRKQLSKRD